MENKLASAAIAGLLADASGKNRKFCEDFLREFFRITADALANGENVRIKGFGTFKLVDVDSRTGVNVSTGEKQEFAAHRKVVFTPAKEMAAIINAPFELFESLEIEDSSEDNSNEERSQNIDIADYNLEEAAVVNENQTEQSIIINGSIEEEEDDLFTAQAYNELSSKEELPEIIPLNDIESLNENEGLNKNEFQEITGDESDSEESELSEDELDNEESFVNEYHIINSEKNKKVKFRHGFFAGAMTSLLICLILFMLGCFFGWWPVNFGSVRDNNPSIESNQQQPLAEEKEYIDESDIAQPEETELTAAIQEENSGPKVYDTVTTTRYLTTIAREHYGNFNFWPYIYLENESFLGHPDRIKPGTRIVVPPLSKYGVDPKNKADIAAAKRLSQEIYEKYR